MEYKKGDIQRLKDSFGFYYRIHTGDEFGQFYSTSCYKTAVNISNELRAK